MSEFLFGLGSGYLSRRAGKIAQKYGAVLVNYCDPGCKCGYGCHDECKACQRHWFAGPNLGEPFNGVMKRAIMMEIKATGIKAG